MTLGFGSSESQPADGELLAELQAAVSEELLRSLEKTEEIIRPDDEEHVRSVLYRFLAAEKMNVAHALTRLEKHAEWREEAVPTGGISEASIEKQIEQQKVLLQPRGPDGRPLIIIRVSKHFPTTHEECERFVIFCLEAASKLVDQAGAASDNKIWALFDLADVKWVNLDRHALFSCFHLLNCHFPERIHKIFMLDAPMTFYALWRIVSPFIDPVTKRKVGYIYGHTGLLAEVDPAIIPEVYGGTGAEVPIEVAVRGLRMGNVSQLESPKGSIESIDLPTAVAVGA